MMRSSVAAQITNASSAGGIEHAVIVPLIKVLDARTGESLYQAELKSSLNGTNPFTGNADSVTTITDLILWNNATAGVSFDDDHGTSFTLTMNESSIMSSELSMTNSGHNNNNTSFTQGSNFLSNMTNTISSSPTPFSFDLETIKLGRSQFSYNGTIVLADVSPPLHVVGGHVLLNLPPSNDTNVVAAQITNASSGIEHAVIVPSIKVLDTRTGMESLYSVELKQSFNGTNPFTGDPDLVTDVTDVLLWNNATAGVSFDDDSGVTLALKLEPRG